MNRDGHLYIFQLFVQIILHIYLVCRLHRLDHYLPMYFNYSELNCTWTSNWKELSMVSIKNVRIKSHKIIAAQVRSIGVLPKHYGYPSLFILTHRS